MIKEGKSTAKHIESSMFEGIWLLLRSVKEKVISEVTFDLTVLTYYD